MDLSLRPPGPAGRRRLRGAQHGAGALHARGRPRFLALERGQPGGVTACGPRRACGARGGMGGGATAMLAAAARNTRLNACAGSPAPIALPSDWPAAAPPRTIAPNTAISMVA